MSDSPPQLRQVWLNRHRPLRAAPLGDVVDHVLAGTRRLPASAAETLHAVLEDALPAALLARVTVGQRRGGSLTLVCADGATRFELQQLQAALLAHLREALGHKAPRTLRLTLA